MHQNRWRQGLRPGTHWGSLQRSPDPLAVMSWRYEICEYTELLGLPGCVPDLTKK